VQSVKKRRKRKKRIKRILRISTTNKGKKSTNPILIESPGLTKSKMSDQNDKNLMAEMAELREKVESKDKKRVGTAQQADIVNASFRILCQILPQFNEMKKYAKQINDLETENANLQKRVTEFEIEKSSKAVIIKNLPPALDSNAGRENQMNLKGNFDRVLTFLKVDSEIKICDIFRIKPKGSADNTRNYPVRVEFGSKIQKGLLMANLHKLRDSDFRDINVGMDCPKILQGLFKELDRKGYQFRMKFPRSKSRIIAKNGTLFLQVKKQSEMNFSNFDDDLLS
jgi:hypothetical protein